MLTLRLLCSYTHWQSKLDQNSKKYEKLFTEKKANRLNDDRKKLTEPKLTKEKKKNRNQQ